MTKTKTAIFEDKYGVDISDFSTTEEVDDFIAEKLGKKSLDVEFIHRDIVSARGAIVPIVNNDINKKFDMAIKRRQFRF